MNELVATIWTDYAPLWGFGATGLVLVVGALFYFKGDNRWERREEAATKAKALAREHEDTVKRLEAADIENRHAIEKLSDATREQHEQLRASLHAFRNDVNAGFLNVNKTVTDGILKISTEVAEMRGRVSGAHGLKQSDE